MKTLKKNIHNTFLVFVFIVIGYPNLFDISMAQEKTKTGNAASFASTETRQATFSMYCYWTGEAVLGRMPGIILSRIGHIGGTEIVEVEYDSARISLKEMVNTLKKQSSFYSVIVKDEDEYSEAARYVRKTGIKVNSTKRHYVKSKYSLRSQYPDLYYLDLTEQQAMVLNSWGYFGGVMPDILTEEQEEMRKKLKEKLSSKNPSNLRPMRSGKALKVYQKELMAWLVD